MKPGKSQPMHIAQAAIAQLRTLIADYDPLELVARVATYIVSGDPDKPKDLGGPQKSETHLEYLLSLVTASPYPIEAKFPDPDAIQRTIDLLVIIHMGVSRHLMSLPVGDSPAEEALGDIAASFRADRLHVRGDGYWPHLRRTSLDLLQRHDAKLLEVLGFTSGDYFTFMEYMETEGQARFDADVEANIRPFVDQIRPWMHENAEGQTVPKDPEAFAKFWEENSAELDAAKLRFDRVHGPTVYRFAARNDAEARILAALSTTIGENTDFHGRKPEHAFSPLTESRTDRRPIIAHGGNHYAFHLTRPQREAYTIIGDLLRAADPEYWEHKFLKARDDYLEAETARLLQQALPSAEVLREVEYPLASGDKAEADIVVLCDDALLVVECKAGRLDPATERGAKLRMISDLEATIAGGLKQAERFARELAARGTMVVTDGKTKRTLTLEVGRFRHLMQVNVTLDLINVAATQLWQLHAAGLTGAVERAWSVSLNDLRVITDILDQPAVFLHYLLRRLDVNVIRRVQARDELDYLMHYVRQGLFFREGNAPKDSEEIMLSGFTEVLDQYYRRVQGLTDKGDKPTVALGILTQQVITLLQTQRPPHWLTGCLALLEFDVPDREALLAKRAEHRVVAGDPNAAYAFSITANLESRKGLAVASAIVPRRAAPLVHGRVIERSRGYGLEESIILLGGLPCWEEDTHVLVASAQSTIDKGVARLLRQLVVHVTEERKE
jgi:hypothetical protein